jgi:hypothetical protein
MHQAAALGMKWKGKPRMHENVPLIYTI